MPLFVAPDRRSRPGPLTECYGCGARRVAHGPKGECPPRGHHFDCAAHRGEACSMPDVCDVEPEPAP